MMTTRQDAEILEQRREELKAEIAAVGDLRPGSLVERYRRCGKPGCRCAQKGAQGHGPSWSLTRQVAGKTVTRVIPAAAVPSTQDQIAEHRRLRGLVRELVETIARLCDVRLETAKASSPEVAKRGASALAVGDLTRGH